MKSLTGLILACLVFNTAVAQTSTQLKQAGEPQITKADKKRMAKHKLIAQDSDLPRGQANQANQETKPKADAKKPKAAKKHDFKSAATAEVYKQASGSDLWIYRFDPPNYDAKQDKRRAVVFFFGGGWNGGKVTQFEQHAKHLAARGMVGFVADYRVQSRQQTTPRDAVADAKSAVRWIRKNSQRLGIDANQIAAGGGSAGGHLAAATGMCDTLDDPSETDSPVSSKPNALLLFNPVYDNGPNYYGHDRVKPWFPAISPAHNITADDPPTITFLGSKDHLIKVATGEKFDEALRAVGVKSELHVYEGQGHGFFNQSKSPESFIDTILKMDEFLVSLGWLDGTADQEKIRSLLRKKKSAKKK